jgi:hypothetical protein
MTASAGQMIVLDVELLVVPDSPNESGALSVLRLAFDRVGLAARSVRTTIIASQEQEQERGFVGSPTILINGVDPLAALRTWVMLGFPRLPRHAVPHMCHRASAQGWVRQITKAGPSR